MSRIIDGETLRTRMVRHRVNGVLGDPEPYTNLLGAPVGDKVEVWTWDRMILPHRSAKRRVRQQFEATHCPEGWYCTSGSPDRPMDGGATCNTIMDPAGSAWAVPGEQRAFSRDPFNAFHAEHPIVWRITIRTGKSVQTLRYCDPELPDEYRPTQEGKKAS